jgi:hypothetical protein
MNEMKKSFAILFALVLLPVFSSAAGAARAQGRTDAAPAPKQVTLTFELQDLPGRDTAGSIWEVSYQWRIADQRDFDRWSAGGEDPAGQAGVGTLLSKQSFTRRNLSTPEGRRFDIAIPVAGELLERLRNAEQKAQVVWLDATVRIHDARLGTDVIKKVHPVWGPRFQREGAYNLRMELTAEGKLRWFTTAAPPWAEGQQQGIKKARTP